MVYILPDDNLLTKSETNTLTYPELASLKQRALNGDASAAIALERMSKSDQRLAELLVEEFTVKSAKGKKFKPAKITKSAKAEKQYRKAVNYLAVKGAERDIKQMFARDAEINPVYREAR